MINCTLAMRKVFVRSRPATVASGPLCPTPQASDSRPLRRRTIAHRPVAGRHPFDVGVALGDQTSPYRATASRQIPIAA